MIRWIRLLRALLFFTDENKSPEAICSSAKNNCIVLHTFLSFEIGLHVERLCLSFFGFMYIRTRVMSVSFEFTLPPTNEKHQKSAFYSAHKLLTKTIVETILLCSVTTSVIEIKLIIQYLFVSIVYI